MSIQRLSHIGICVSDLQRSLGFYRDALGFRELSRIAVEGAESALATGSGMAAISGTLLQLCNAGDHIVSSNTVYGGTYALMNDFLPVIRQLPVVI